jgi:hypothetical protein
MIICVRCIGQTWMKPLEENVGEAQSRGVDSLGGVVYHVWPRGIFWGGILMAWTN